LEGGQYAWDESRLAGDGDHKISDEMDAVAIKGLPRVEVRNEKGDPISVTLEIRTKRVHVLPPIEPAREI
jgi:hypothetical protein